MEESLNSYGQQYQYQQNQQSPFTNHWT